MDWREVSGCGDESCEPLRPSFQYSEKEKASSYKQNFTMATLVGRPMEKHKWITQERIDKFLSTTYWKDCNLVSTERCVLTTLQDEQPSCGKPGLKVVYVSYPDPQHRPSFSEVAQIAAPSWRPAKLHDRFGPLYSTHWFKVEATFPDDERRAIYLDWHTGSEGLVFDKHGDVMCGVTGEGRDLILLKPSTSDQGDSSSRKRGRHDDPNATTPAPTTMSCTAVALFVEMACNALSGDGKDGCIQPPDLERHFSLDRAQLVALNDAPMRLRRDLTLMLQMSQDENFDSVLGETALFEANCAVNAFRADVPDTWERAAAICDDFFQRCGPPADRSVDQMRPSHTIYAVGNCHIDTAWLWPFRETRRKVARSWASQLVLLDRHKDFHFVASQAQQFDWLRRDYPKLFSEIVESHQAGRFGVTGATWVEMDGNLPSGESFMRQFLHGQKFFQKHFGSICDIFWLPDTFGYSAQLPQIASLCGVKYFMSQKLSWNLINKPRHTTFYWVGLDGKSKLLTHFPPADCYTCHVTVAELAKTAVKNKDVGRCSASMLLYGYGDGGGGPTEDMVQRLERLQQLPLLSHRVKMADPSACFKAMEAAEGHRLALLEHVGELYFEMHRGTYTSQALVKQMHRRCEDLLIQCEAASVLLTCMLPIGEIAVTCQRARELLHAAWEDVLLAEFHDVLPGSSIELVYDDTKRMLSSVIDSLTKFFEDTISSIVRCSGVQPLPEGKCLVNMRPQACPYTGLGAFSITSAQWGRASAGSYQLHSYREFAFRGLAPHCPPSIHMRHRFQRYHHALHEEIPCRRVARGHGQW